MLLHTLTGWENYGMPTLAEMTVVPFGDIQLVYMTHRLLLCSCALNLAACQCCICLVCLTYKHQCNFVFRTDFKCGNNSVELLFLLRWSLFKRTDISLSLITMSSLRWGGIKEKKQRLGSEIRADVRMRAAGQMWFTHMRAQAYRV